MVYVKRISVEWTRTREELRDTQRQTHIATNKNRFFLCNARVIFFFASPPFPFHLKHSSNMKRAPAIPWSYPFSAFVYTIFSHYLFKIKYEKKNHIFFPTFGYMCVWECVCIASHCNEFSKASEKKLFYLRCPGIFVFGKFCIAHIQNHQKKEREWVFQKKRSEWKKNEQKFDEINRKN